MKNPKLIVKPFAKNGQKNAIPENYETSMDSNQATWDQGFGQITMLPVAAGGLPPKGQDFNGILNQISGNIVYQSQGGRFKFSPEYAESIGGYPKGAILQSDDEKKEYQSIIDNNKVNFNTATQAQINAAWKLFSTDDILEQIAGKQPAGDYATNAALNTGLDGKFDKTGGTISGDVTFSKNAIKSTKGTHVLPDKSGTLMQVGDYGWGGAGWDKELSNPELIEFYRNENTPTQVFRNTVETDSSFAYSVIAYFRARYGFSAFTASHEGKGVRVIAGDSNNDQVFTYNLYTDRNTTKDHNGNLKVSGSSSELSDYPVGAPIPWPQPVPPSGFLVCNGQAFDKATYPLLALAYPSGFLPDLRGEFIRGWDDGRGVDNGRSILSSQSDTLQDHGHESIRLRSVGANGGNIPVPDGAADFTGDADLINAISVHAFNGGAPRVSGETRPRNIAFNYIVRAA